MPLIVKMQTRKYIANSSKEMADDKSTSSPETCGTNYVVIPAVIASLLTVVCICLGIWIIYLKRRPNGYVTIRGNENELQKYKAMVEQERKEKENALRRLSRLASDRLTDDNPNIADLSDLKRPTKLADEFSELYDNEWTDAYESLDDMGGKGEEEIIGFLLQILQISFRWCRLQATDQFTKLHRLLLFPGEIHETTEHKPDSVGVDKGLIKSFKDERKRLGSRTGQNVSKRVFEAVKTEFKSSTWKAELLKTEVQNYCTQCAQLCWFLAVQDPPVDIKFTDRNKNDFKPYTKSGNELNFIVWPPLFLHTDGHLLAKGIAQFR